MTLTALHSSPCTTITFRSLQLFFPTPSMIFFHKSSSRFFLFQLFPSMIVVIHELFLFLFVLSTFFPPTVLHTDLLLSILRYTSTFLISSKEFLALFSVSKAYVFKNPFFYTDLEPVTDQVLPSTSCQSL